MIDKRTEGNTRDLSSFLESWGKFHQLYNEVTAKPIVTKEDEAVFVETKELIRKKYDELRLRLEFQYMPFSRLTDPIVDILALDTISHMSETKLKKMEDDWNDAYIFLNNILERLKNRKRRLEHFSGVGVWAKRLFEKIGGEGR